MDGAVRANSYPYALFSLGTQARKVLRRKQNHGRIALRALMNQSTIK